MKRKLFLVVAALVVLVVGAIVVAALFGGSIVKKGVETVGPRITKVDVTLDGATLSLLTGSGSLRGFLVGNPEGYKTAAAVQVERVGVAVKPGSIFSDKVVVRSIEVKGPEITWEGSLKGNNLSQILDNIQSENRNKPEPEATGGKRLQVDDFLIEGAKLHLSTPMLGGKAATVPLPKIHLKDLGRGPEGITPAELSEKVFRAILAEASRVASAWLADLGKEVTGAAAQDIGKKATEQLDKATKGMGDLIRKKE